MPRVAVLQHASQALLEEGVHGMLDGLAASGFVAGKNIIIDRFNAENDVGTANAIARQITSGGYDLAMTSSTRSLQAVANANRDGRLKHVFGIVADPSVAGVGVSKTDPLEKWLGPRRKGRSRAIPALLREVAANQRGFNAVGI